MEIGRSRHSDSIRLFLARFATMSIRKQLSVQGATVDSRLGVTASPVAAGTPTVSARPMNVKRGRYLTSS